MSFASSWDARHIYTLLAWVLNIEITSDSGTLRISGVLGRGAEELAIAAADPAVHISKICSLWRIRVT